MLKLVGQQNKIPAKSNILPQEQISIQQTTITDQLKLKFEEYEEKKDNVIKEINVNLASFIEK